MSKLEELCERAEKLDIDITCLAGSLEFVRLNYDNCSNIKELGVILYSLQNEAKRVATESEDVNERACEVARMYEAVTT